MQGVDCVIAISHLDTGDEPRYKMLLNYNPQVSASLALRMAPPLPLVFLLMVVGASGAEWSVNYNQQQICALKGSTVFMRGSFTHPEGLTVMETFWAIRLVHGEEPPDMNQNSDYSGRVEYFTDKQKHFFLKLSNVKKADEHEFYVRIRTNVETQRWLGKPGVQLSVTELHVESPGEVTEGQSAVLTCKTTCSLTDPTFIWYKNGRPLTTKTIKNNQLHLQTVSSEDAGRYSCAVRGSEHLPSTAQTLRVRYPPKSVSVSISPSGEIVVGSSVTLMCSSEANPPVKIYTWFKGSSSVGKGETYSFPNISSEDSGGYTCQSHNELGERSSTAVYLNVLYPPKSVSVSISPSGEIVERGSVTLKCNSDANPPVQDYTWFKGSSSVGKGQTYSFPNISSEDSGGYTCQSHNELGERSSTAVYLNVLYPPKNVSVSISPSGEIVERGSVTLNCNSDANPPVQNYTWFKGSSSVGKGETYSFPNISSEDSGGYTCQSHNELGERSSTAVYLNVLYPPKSVSVSISPSGEIVERGSVTLKCNSDANPPVQDYTWFKGSSSVGKGQTYSFPNISSEDSGGYTCQSHNELGERSSTAVYLNVLYPPKNVSMSINPFGGRLEGSSVNLTCSSNANPPVQNYTWFKEGGSLPVGSGHSYIPLQSGSYYCQAHNQHGAQRSAAVLVILKAGLWVILYVVVGVVGVCGVAAFLTVVFCTRRKKQNGNVNEEIYANVEDCVHPPDDDSSSIPDYENVENVGDSTGPPGDDSSSTPDYEKVENVGDSTYPSEADSSSIPDYENMDNN
ncbi:B-cell receptor CD22-like [Salminus brasiliensis]|uniref:B-cell receptor CD22-like n=1 Tax=Salminus brasiliensis TaxID=930266 RepID=UPI003B8387F1